MLLQCRHSSSHSLTVSLLHDTQNMAEDTSLGPDVPAATSSTTASSSTAAAPTEASQSSSSAVTAVALTSGQPHQVRPLVMLAASIAARAIWITFVLGPCVSLRAGY